MKTAGKVAAGVLAGAAAGAAMGILFAPDKGTETRHKIAQKTKDLKDEVKEKLHFHHGNGKENKMNEEVNENKV